MRLAVVTNILTPYRIPLFEALQQRVDDFTVLLMAAREENRDWNLERCSFRSEVLPGIHIKPSGRPVSIHWNYGIIPRLWRMAPEVVLSGGFGSANIGALIYCKMFRKTFIGWGELMLGKTKASWRVRNGIRRWVTGWSDGSIASSSNARDVFLHYGACAEHVLTCVMPIDVDRFHQSTKAFRKTPEHRELRTRYSRPILFTAGRIVREKGYPELFRIYERVLEAFPRASLIIAGEGPDRSRYERETHARGWKQVHFVGFKQMNELVPFLGIADLFVFPTLRDPFGAVLSEAMAAGLPVASSVFAAATRDLVEDGVSGFRIDPKDLESSVTIVLKMLNLGPQQRAALGEAAYTRVKQCDVPASADRMVGFMKSVLNRKKNSAGHLVECRR